MLCGGGGGNSNTYLAMYINDAGNSTLSLHCIAKLHFLLGSKHFLLNVTVTVPVHIGKEIFKIIF